MHDLSALSTCLNGAFGGDSPTFLCDSVEVVDALKASGVEAYLFDEVPSIDPVRLRSIVMIPVDFSTTPLGAFIEHHFASSAMLVIPVASFCRSPRGALYFLSLLKDIDLQRCIRGNLRWLDQLETATELRLVGNGTDVTVTLAEELYLMSPKTTVEITPGEWVSIAQYLEVGLVGHANGAKPLHTMNGTFSADGIVVASHRYAAKDVLPMVHTAWAYLQDVRARNGGAPVVVDIQDSRPVAITCGSENVTDEVKALTDPNKREFVTEFGFAADPQWDFDRVDWSMNSQLNEAIGGIHLGLGTGVTGVHIDLVAPHVTLAS